MVLRPLREDDADHLFRWINDRELVAFNAPFTPVSREHHDAWFRRIRGRGDVRIFGIEESSSGRLVGSCQLLNIQPDAGTADLQIRIGERDAWSRGLGTHAVQALLSFGHRDLGLRQVSLSVRADNPRAIRMYEKCGFVSVGIVRAAVQIEGRTVDMARMTVRLP
jgi:RimJ/RimL family protein N-acetyltransferase